MKRSVLYVVCACAWLFSACGKPPLTLDPDRVFRYGQIQFDEARQVFILTAQSLEEGEGQHDLVIDSTHDNDQRICIELTRTIKEGGGTREVCLTLEALRRVAATR